MHVRNSYYSIIIISICIMTWARNVARTEKGKGLCSGKITPRKDVNSDAKDGISSFGHTFYPDDVQL
jgi:hypothetical protein